MVVKALDELIENLEEESRETNNYQRKQGIKVEKAIFTSFKEAEGHTLTLGEIRVIMKGFDETDSRKYGLRGIYVNTMRPLMTRWQIQRLGIRITRVPGGKLSEDTQYRVTFDPELRVHKS